MVGDDITVTVLGVKGNQVRIGVNAPRDVAVHREEIYERMHNGRPEALTPRFTVDHGFVLRLLQKAEETLEDPMAELDALVDGFEAEAA